MSLATLCPSLWVDPMTKDSLIKKILITIDEFLESLKPLHPVLKYLEPIILLTFFIAFGFLVSWSAKKLLQINDNTVDMVLILLPTLGYIILAGRLSALKGPGGFEAQFVVASKQKIVGYEMINFENVETREKVGLDYLYNKIIPNLQPSKPTVLTFILGGNNYYIHEIILKYLNVLSQYQVIKFAVFLNTEREFVAYTSLSQLKHILAIPNGREEENSNYNINTREGKNFVKDLMSGNINSLLRYPGIMNTTISATSTNIEALQVMSDNNLEAIIVVDEHRRLKGIIKKEQILTKLMLSVAKGL